MKIRDELAPARYEIRVPEALNTLPDVSALQLFRVFRANLKKPYHRRRLSTLFNTNLGEFSTHNYV